MPCYLDSHVRRHLKHHHFAAWGGLIHAWLHKNVVQSVVLHILYVPNTSFDNCIVYLRVGIELSIHTVALKVTPQDQFSGGSPQVVGVNPQGEISGICRSPQCSGSGISLRA